MNDHPTPEEVRASIVPKSDQLNADDLVTGPITVTVTAVKRGDKDQPIIVEIDGHRPYKPCKTMRRVLIATWSDDPKNWIGQKMTLYCDSDVTWAGVKVGGIRISHLSGLDEPKTLILTKTRGKREEITVFPVETLSPEDSAYVAEITSEIAKAETLETLKAIWFVWKQKPAVITNAIIPIHEARKEILDHANDSN